MNSFFSFQLFVQFLSFVMMEATPTERAGTPTGSRRGLQIASLFACCPFNPNL